MPFREDTLPLQNYDRQNAGAIAAKLSALTQDELRVIHDYESAAGQPRDRAGADRRALRRRAVGRLRRAGRDDDRREGGAASTGTAAAVDELRARAQGAGPGHPRRRPGA